MIGAMGSNMFQLQGKWGWVWGLVLVGGISGCSQSEGLSSQNSSSPGEENVNKPEVVAATQVLCDLTRQIAQETLQLTCLMQPGQDPHTYEMTPSDRRAIETADLVLYSGFSFPLGMVQTIESVKSDQERLAVYEVAVPQPRLIKEHDHGHEHEHEDVHEDRPVNAANPKNSETSQNQDLVADPHVWHYAPHNAAMVEVIRDRLQQLAPEHKMQYQRTASSLIESFQSIDTWIKAQISTIPATSRKLITTHEALGYFAEGYGLTLAGALEGLSTEERPSAARIAALAQQVKSTGVPAIFAESSVSRELIQAVAQEAGVTVATSPLFVDGPGEPGSGAETVSTLLIHNTCTIVNALGGQCTPLSLPAQPPS